VSLATEQASGRWSSAPWAAAEPCPAAIRRWRTGCPGHTPIRTSPTPPENHDRCHRPRQPIRHRPRCDAATGARNVGCVRILFSILLPWMVNAPHRGRFGRHGLGVSRELLASSLSAELSGRTKSMAWRPADILKMGGVRPLRLEKSEDQRHHTPRRMRRSRPLLPAGLTVWSRLCMHSKPIRIAVPSLRSAKGKVDGAPSLVRLQASRLSRHL
jgi:hypothetical protein